MKNSGKGGIITHYQRKLIKMEGRMERSIVKSFDFGSYYVDFFYMES